MRAWAVFACGVVTLAGCYRQHGPTPASGTAPEAPAAGNASVQDAAILDAAPAVGASQDAAPFVPGATDSATPEAGIDAGCDRPRCGVLPDEPFGQEAYIKASNTAPDARFGSAVAIDGDTLVVGAPGDDGTAEDSGAVYVFVRNAGTWSEQAYLKAGNPASGADFGYSVGVFDDTIVVGAPAERGKSSGIDGDEHDLGTTAAGAAYVFVRERGGWSQQAYLKSATTVLVSTFGTPVANDFGQSVAISADTVVVGAPSESSNATGVDGDPTDTSAASSGAAFVFVRSGTVWSAQAYLKASNTAYRNWFGTSVGVAEDTIAVGAPGEASFTTGVDGDDSDKSAGHSGAGYVFVRSGATWSQQAFLKAGSTRPVSDEADGALLGTSIAVSGDRVAIGAKCERGGSVGIDGDQSDMSGLCSGAAYVFERSNGGWTPGPYLKASNAEEFDLFGTSVAMFGDTVVIGAIRRRQRRHRRQR